MLSNFAKFNRGYLLVALLLLWTGHAAAEPATSEDCRPLPTPSLEAGQPLAYADAVLWRVDKEERQPSYLFGTIHVADPKISTLSQPVADALDSAQVFVMEALPDLEESIKFSQMMYFDDGKKLRDYLDEEMYKRTMQILEDYQLTPEDLVFMQPWAAFILMSYPQGEGLPLDLQLLDIAQRNGIDIRGLETLSEQGRVFSTMNLESQVRLLLDTVCNYGTVSGEFDTMKSLYLQRDLQALYNYSRKNSFAGDQLYEDLFKSLLTDRNHVMVERMQPVLEAGNAFIAIGAMHLPGADGILSLLAQQGYTITAVY